MTPQVEGVGEGERPILFSAPMVRAILDGRKTQRRRIVKPPMKWGERFPVCNPAAMAADHSVWWWDGEFDRVGVAQSCPYGATGDRLYVRETWRAEARFDNFKPREIAAGNLISYDADYPDRDRPNNGCRGKTRVSIHMPRWASRITLEITDVRVERLNDISEADATAEGTQEPSLVPIVGVAWSERGMYAKLWEHINGAGSWGANPWVWAVTFKAAALGDPR